MSQSPWIKLNGKTYSHEGLKRQAFPLAQTDFENTTLKFCQGWLNGQQEFTIQTSGSTGIPKSIILRRSQMEASAKQTIEALQLKVGETSLVCLDTNYIAGKMMLVRSLIAGMNAVAIAPSSNPFEKIIDQQIDFVALVPYQLENVLDHANEKLGRVRCALVGGAAISISLKEKLKGSGCSMHATYGMTETISHIALQRLNGVNPQDFFEALPSISLRKDGRGCLCIKANYLEEEIATNDLVELMDDKKFRWLGRIDNIINSGGIKIIPEKVELVFEKILRSFQIVQRFFVSGLPDEKWGNKLVIIFEGLPLTNEIRKEILLAANQQLNKYETPKEFVFVPQFKETANGKIHRAATVTSIQ